jgi:hypothetical protein
MKQQRQRYDVDVADPIEQLIDEYLAGGESLRAFAERKGAVYTTLHRRLRQRGLHAKPYKQPDRLKRPDMAPYLADYRAGTSLKGLAARAGVSRDAMSRWLDQEGQEQRGRSEAMRARWAGMADDERRELVRAAHEATRGRKASIDERARNAVTRGGMECFIGLGEDEVAGLLEGIGLDVPRQVPEGRFNIDVAVGNVAVEVVRHTNNPAKRPSQVERAEALEAAGWRVLFLWCYRCVRTPGAFCMTPESAAALVAGVLQDVPSRHVVRCSPLER